MRKKILIPTDFSRNAWDAIAYTVDLFREVSCDIYILNVYNPANYATDNIMVPTFDEGWYAAVKENSEKELAKILQRLSFRDESIDHQFTTLSQHNVLLDGIKEIVELRDIDLIVMGTKGDSDALNRIFGSQTVMIMEKVVNCPVLAIPPQSLYTTIDEIVFPTDFKKHFKKKELETLIELAQLTGASIEILSIAVASLTIEQLNYKQLLEECFEGLIFNYHTVESKHISEAIEVFVQSRNSGMIAFVNSRHTIFSNLFKNLMVKELGLHAKVPVLALHEHPN